MRFRSERRGGPHAPDRMGVAARIGDRVAALLLVAALAPVGLTAQGIEGTVRHEVSGEPLTGVLVSVLGPDGARVRGVLTDGQGGFRVEVPLGRYSLRAERIGLRTETTEPFELRTFRFQLHRIEMVERAVEIEGLVVDSRVQSCRIDRESAGRIQRWWSEVRTALDVSAALQSEEFGHFLVEHFDREWDGGLERVLGANRRFVGSRSTRPFRSAPAQELVRDGFVQGTYGPDRLYFGPDAEVLLSSAFLTSHCFSLMDGGEREGLLGLRFEPVEGRDVPDIEGTMWVDTTSAELRDLDFRYVNVDGPEARNAGGRIVFSYLPSGAWIVSDWYIRMPKTGRRGRRLRTTGYYDGGGAVTELPSPAEGAPVGSIEGVLVDSLRGGGLVDANVVLLTTGQQAVSDSLGRYRFDRVPAGPHYLTFRHDEVDTWGLGVGYTTVPVRAGEVARPELSLPGFEQSATALCLGDGVDAETVVVGHLVGPGRRPLPGRSFRLTYSGGRVESSIFLTADEEGRFVTCAIPGGTLVTLGMNFGGGVADVADFVAREGEVTYREIWFTR